jgi:hypothetical protein
MTRLEISVIRPLSTLIIIYDDHNFSRELQYVLPLKSRHLFPEFFAMLDSQKESFEITGYGLQDVSLEEVFLKVTEQYKKSPLAATVEAQMNNNETNENAAGTSPTT